MFSSIIKSPTDPLNISGDFTVTGDLTVTGGKITFGNAEIVDNETDNTLKLTSNFLHFDSPAVATFYIDSHTGSDSKLILLEGGGPKWLIGNDADDDRLITVCGSVTLGVGTDRLSLNPEACLGIGKGVAAPDSDAESCIYIKKGVSPGEAVQDYVYIYSKDSSGTGTDSKTTLGIYCEEGVDATALDAVGTLTTRIPIWVNDTCYWLYLDPV
jgi:hypothetical protein